MGLTSSFSTLRVFLWRLAVSRFSQFSGIDTVFTSRHVTAAAAENEPCKVCPLSAYRLLLLLQIPQVIAGAPRKRSQPSGSDAPRPAAATRNKLVSCMDDDEDGDEEM